MTKLLHSVSSCSEGISLYETAVRHLLNSVSHLIKFDSWDIQATNKTMGNVVSLYGKNLLQLPVGKRLFDGSCNSLGT